MSIVRVPEYTVVTIHSSAYRCDKDGCDEESPFPIKPGWTTVVVMGHEAEHFCPRHQHSRRRDDKDVGA